MNGDVASLETRVIDCSSIGVPINGGGDSPLPYQRDNGVTCFDRRTSQRRSDQT